MYFIVSVGSETATAAPVEGQLSAYEIKQLQQQNARLRETLVKLRDLSAHEKHEYQKLLKDIDQKKSEISELGKTKEKLSTRVEEMEQQIADLQEQVISKKISFFDSSKRFFSFTGRCGIGCRRNGSHLG